MVSIRELWRHPIHQAAHSRTLISRDVIIVPERRCHLTRLAPDSGDVLWDARVDNTWGWLCADAQRCYWLNQHHRLQALDIESGAQLWESSVPGISGYLTVHQGVVVSGGWRGYTDIVGLDSDTGEPLWTIPARGGDASHPVSTGAGLAVPTRRAIDFYASDGQAVHSVVLPGELCTTDAGGGVCVNDGLTYAATSCGSVWVLETSSSEWRRVLKHVARHEHAPPCRASAPRT